MLRFLWLCTRAKLKNQYDFVALIVMFFFINYALVERYSLSVQIEQDSSSEVTDTEMVMLYVGIGMSVVMLVILLVITRPVYNACYEDIFFEMGGD